jgi:hypothetical protein
VVRTSPTLKSFCTWSSLFEKYRITYKHRHFQSAANIHMHSKMKRSWPVTGTVTVSSLRDWKSCKHFTWTAGIQSVIQTNYLLNIKAGVQTAISHYLITRKVT